MALTTLILAAALAQPAPSAQTLPPILVPQLELGMGKEQFNALWPKLRAPFGPGCTARLWPSFRHGKLYGIGIENSEPEPASACGKFVRDWARAAFGKPEHDGDNSISGNCASGGFASNFRDMAVPCGPDDVKDWADWQPLDRQYVADVSAQRKSGQWSFHIYPR